MSSKVWVGRLSQKSVVFDSEMQPINRHHVYLWDPAANDMQKYVAEITRGVIRKHNDREQSNNIISLYEAWKSKNLSAWLARVAEINTDDADDDGKVASRKESRELSITEKHKVKLKSAGKPYIGTRQAAPNIPRRVSNCYSCQNTVDNSINLECIACGWILCKCGACGCGFTGHKK